MKLTQHQFIPPIRRNAELRRSKDITKMYKRRSTPINLAKPCTNRSNFPVVDKPGINLVHFDWQNPILLFSEWLTSRT